MNLQRVKSTGDIKLNGISVDAEWRDGSLAGVTLTDASGNLLRLVLENFSVGAFIQAAPKKKTVHVVEGRVRGVGIDVREQFDDLYEANTRKNELDQADVFDAVTVKPEEVEIPF